MKKKFLGKPYKKLAKSQRKLKRAFANLGKTETQAENPVWVTALAAIAGAVTTALADRDKRARLGEIAVEAKDKAVGLLREPPPEKEDVRKPAEVEDLHL